MAGVPANDDVPLAVLQRFPGIDLLESPNGTIHEHGGDAAKVSSLLLMFEINDHRAHEIVANRVELLRRHCMEKDWHSRKTLELGGYRSDNSKPPPGSARLVVPAEEPRRYGVYIRFAPVEVYQACDAFGFAIDLDVDRIRHVFEIPFDVTRVEPME